MTIYNAEEIIQPGKLELSLDWAIQNIRRTIPRLGNARPGIGRDDLKYELCSEHDWVEGFWSGQLWLAYAFTGDSLFLKAAREQKVYFDERLKLYQTHSHDLGFLYTLSNVANYKLTGNNHSRNLALAAAAMLEGRFNSKGSFIQAWNSRSDDPEDLKQRLRGRFIIDCMENLGLLYWASLETGFPFYQDVAIAHAETTARYMVRPDGSTYHAYDFNYLSGEPIGGLTHQGFSDESCWSRGQSWAIHGFALSYAYTGRELFRDTACRLADFAISKLPEDGIPYWDYLLPDSEPHYRDSSAAAILAAGLLLLAGLLDKKDKDTVRASGYRNAALHTLNTLAIGYTTANSPEAEGLLVHGAAFVKLGKVDNMLPYGDYFFVEALLRAHGWHNFFW